MKNKKYNTIAVVGPPGAGKTTLCRIFVKQKLAYHINVDIISRKLARQKHFLEKIKNHINLNKTPTYDEYKTLFFKDKKVRNLAQSILIPKTTNKTKKIIENLHSKTNKLILLESAVLYKLNNLLNFCSLLLYIHVDINICIQRLITQRGYTKDKAKKLIQLQNLEFYYNIYPILFLNNNQNNITQLYNTSILLHKQITKALNV